jgi:hypothetical protein
MDLILVDGCANDVGVGRILDPKTDPAELESLTWQFCRDEMRLLLLRLREMAPQAHIVVTGYFPFLSGESALDGIEQWVPTQSTAVFHIGDFWDTVHDLTTNATVFHDTSRESLAAAVEAVNADTIGQPAIAFADPNFGPRNATFASEAWLWGLTLNETLAHTFEWGADLRLFPEDPLLDYRLSACLEAGVLSDFLSCVYTSVGHPNPAGARAYADAIAESLIQLGVLPGPSAD